VDGSSIIGTPLNLFTVSPCPLERESHQMSRNLPPASSIPVVCIPWIGRMLVVLAFAGVVHETPSHAQQPIRVQQPVLGVNSSATTVVVPDRGRALIGGVRRGASGRSRYGFAPPNQSTGTEISGSSMSVSVTVHDFAEMDAQALAQPTRSAVPSRAPRLSPRAEWAWQNLSARPGVAQAAIRR
jgi:hypothetical protein